MALAAVAKFCEALQAEEPAVSPYLARKAVEAAARFGKVVGHKADLNFGDCFAYAHAQARSEALLFEAMTSPIPTFRAPFLTRGRFPEQSDDRPAKAGGQHGSLLAKAPDEGQSASS